jgi:peptide/nickel transport system permease protein
MAGLTPFQGEPLNLMAENIPVDEGFNVSRNTTWRRFRRHKVALAGGIVIALMAFFAAFGHFIYPVDPNAIDQVNWTGYPLAPGVAGHPLGTDENGRDLLARLIAGGQVSLTVALFAVMMQVVIGSILGALAGIYGGWVDFVIMRFTDVVLSIPLLPLLLVLTAIVSATSNKASLSFGVIVVLIGGLTWPAAARLVRASFLSLREREFAEAARAIGGNDARIIFRHLLPNAIAPIIVQATLAVAGVILTESVLSFLGFGIQPPQASWGNMLANAQSMITIAPGVAIFPGLCILIVSLSINYLGDGLRDALDPNQR